MYTPDSIIKSCYAIFSLFIIIFFSVTNPQAANSKPRIVQSHNYLKSERNGRVDGTNPFDRPSIGRSRLPRPLPKTKENSKWEGS